MTAQRALYRMKRFGKEAYQYQFTSTFEYITLQCTGTWRPTELKVVWFRSHRRVESIPVQWVVSEDRGPNGASGGAKFKPALSVGLIVTLYKGKQESKFEGKEYKYYVQDESKRGAKVLASFTIDLRDYAKTERQGSRNVFEMTFQNESQKVRDVTLGMTLTSQFLKKGKAIDYDMQSTFSAMTSDQCSQMLDSDETGDSEGEDGGRRETGRGDEPREEEVHVVEVAPAQTGLEVDSSFNGSKSRQNGTRLITPECNGVRIGMELPTNRKLTDPSLSSLDPLQRMTALSSLGNKAPSTTPSPPPLTSQSATRSPSPPVSTQRGAEKKTKKAKRDKKMVKFFGISHHPSASDHQEKYQDRPGVSPSPSPPSPSFPPPTVTDNTQRLTEMVKKLKESVAKLENENKQLHASMEIQGWLFKRGVRGVTARVWRRRFFRVEGSKIYYYKTSNSPHAQGFIDLDLVLGVREVCPEEQDKNCSTFIVRCEGRTYQLQAINQTTMRKWLNAIQFLADWRKSYGEKREADKDDNSTDASHLQNLTAVQ